MSVSTNISIVIPAYNERERLPSTLDAIAKHLAAGGHEAELVVVDDGSTDGTAEVARAEAERLGLSLRILSYRPNRGKGYAVREGMLAAEGKAVLLTDADESVSIDHLDRFLHCMEEGVEVVVGSRRAAGARIEVHQPYWRERLGTIFRDLARSVLPGITDFTCGFKLFSRHAAREIFPLQRLSGWGYDVEILLIARRRGLTMTELPVIWRDDSRSRVRLWKDGVRSGIELVRIGWNDWRGFYRGPR